MLIEQMVPSERIRTLEHALQSGDNILIEELWNSPKALIASIAAKATGKHVVILTGASQEEAQLFHDFAFFSDRQVIEFPSWETLPGDHISPSPDIVGERGKVLNQILKSETPFIILTSLQACLQKVIPPKLFNKLYLSLKVGQTIPYERLLSQFIEMGYKRQPVAAEKGEYAIRGGIIDVFPVSTPDPYRIEFFGDEIESIRLYDPVGQKSVQPMEQIEISPANELELTHSVEQPSSFLEFLGKNTLVIFDDLLALEDRYAALVSMGGTPSKTFSGMEHFFDELEAVQKIFFTSQPIEELSELNILDRQTSSYYSENAPIYRVEFQMFNRLFPAKRWRHSFTPISNFLLPDIDESHQVSGDEILQSLNQLSQTDYSLHFLFATEAEEIALKNRIEKAKIQLPTNSHYHHGYLSSGMVFSDEKMILLPNTELTHRYKIRRQKQRSTYHTIQSPFYDLSPGEMVVHLQHGIGRYLGLEKKPNFEGVETEFFQLEYADGAKLYVPINQAYQISKYIGATDEIPKMHTIGSNRWKKTRELTEKAIIHYAKDLLQLYAKRSIKEGFSYPEDSPDMQAFEEDFPYIETEDQLSAIAAIKNDMMANTSMDRLICGDVGYGKTEVAMRAAFKAVLDGRKQVAILVPTTVLALQHYETFVDRMANFPVNIGILSRFNSAKETRKTLEGIAAGSIDIVIGTHRIVSGDVAFKDLGLVIIDEEQRFGVKAKEHLKKIKINVDCLTLSATPIPRTLYMSLVGVRDMSVINSPPQDRLPISTMIAEPHEQNIKNALLRELARDGQAFYIHNRVETIYEAADRIKKLLPHARIVVAHGQMHSDEIDEVFHAFKNGRADILVATTIVENGIDIPNANTILIEKADHFGMADLYQLRGRVGRWNRRAYAYFLVKNMHRLPEIARKRLEALAKSSGHGGGMKVAMHDLELRGAGNLLGTEQSGHVAAIGFHHYVKMLKRTVQALQGKIPIDIAETKIEFPFDARLPEDYINEVSLRMEFYQRLGEAISWEEADAIWEEIQDRFGPPPEPAKYLYHYTRLRIYGAIHHFSLIKMEKVSIFAERKQGSRTISKNILFSKIKNPEEVENKVIELLARGFSIQPQD